MKKKNNPLFVYYLLLGTISSLASECRRCTFTCTTSRHGQAGWKSASKHWVTKDRTGEKTTQAGTELRLQCLQKNPDGSKKD